MNLENGGERMDIDYYNMNYDMFDIYQKSHYKRYEFAKTCMNSEDVVGDMACGSGYGSMMLLEKCNEMHGFDIDDITINEIKQRYSDKSNVTFNVSDLLNINGYDNFFDKIVSFETVEHFDPNDIKELISIFHRSLKDGGKLIFSTPYNQEDSEASRKFHKTFHIVEQTIIEMLSGYFTIDTLLYQNYSHHDLTTHLDHKNFIICVATKMPSLDDKLSLIDQFRKIESESGQPYFNSNFIINKILNIDADQLSKVIKTKDQADAFIEALKNLK